MKEPVVSEYFLVWRFYNRIVYDGIIEIVREVKIMEFTNEVNWKLIMMRPIAFKILTG